MCCVTSQIVWKPRLVSSFRIHKCDVQLEASRAQTLRMDLTEKSVKLAYSYVKVEYFIYLLKHALRGSLLTIRPTN